MTAKQEKILDSALKLFVDQGFHNTPTSLIAKHAGVSNGTLFHYYDTKDDLVHALYTSVAINMDEFILATLKEDQPVKGKVHNIWEGHINWAMDNKHKYLFMRQYQSSSYSYTGSKVTNVRTRTFMDIIETGIRQNILGFMPVDFVYELFEANVHGMVGYFMKNPVKYRTPEFIRQTFEIYWNSIKNHAYQSVLN